MNQRRTKFLRPVSRKQRNWTTVLFFTFVAALVSLYVALLTGLPLAKQLVIWLFFS